VPSPIFPQTVYVYSINDFLILNTDRNVIHCMANCYIIFMLPMTNGPTNHKPCIQCCGMEMGLPMLRSSYPGRFSTAWIMVSLWENLPALKVGIYKDDVNFRLTLYTYIKSASSLIKHRRFSQAFVKLGTPPGALPGTFETLPGTPVRNTPEPTWNTTEPR
jgi:hypothetical protein